MGEKHSLFFDEWRACLRAHYLHVLRTNDTVTEPTLRRVLLQTGLTQEELDALHAEAGVEPAPAEDHTAGPPQAEAASAVYAGAEPLASEEDDLPPDDLDDYRDDWDAPVAGLNQLSLF